MATVKVTVKKFQTRKQDLLFDVLNNDAAVRKSVNKMVADAIQPFVPMKSGRLRRSLIVGTKSISWGRGLPYAHYQHEGEVYGPNIPITANGKIVGWYSRPGETKYPTGRELGVPGYWKGWKFGYTTPGTRHHWEQALQGEVKRQMNLKITRYLKMLCKRIGLNP